MSSKRIYLDHSATTPVAEEVIEAMEPYFSEKFGNPSSLHSFGRESRDALEKSRKQIADFIGARPSEIIFTGVGTEADNLAIMGVAFSENAAFGTKNQRNHIITSKIEHPAVRETCKYLEKRGWKITWLDVNSEGLINPRDVENAITKETILVTIMHVNNEIGTIQPIEEIGKICAKHKVYFHTDAVQSYGKISINVKKMNIDLLSASAHKIYGPKGIGFLYVHQDVKIVPITHGGGHETGLRSGTENIPGIVGFAKATELASKNMKSEAERIGKMKDKLVKELLKIPGSRINGSKDQRIYVNINISFEGVEGEALLLRLDEKGIAVSTGSACSSKSLEPSPVLTAIGLKPEQAHGSLRITFGKENREEDIDYIAEQIKNVVGSLRKISPFKKNW
ncbi:MAG: cysteine desulfurase NifS [Candidatus Pacearchaeota archaeon]|nr:cysteine desulfurase NifS [Candidatus Pacearchaeota archaeon]